MFCIESSIEHRIEFSRGQSSRRGTGEDVLKAMTGQEDVSFSIMSLV